MSDEHLFPKNFIRIKKEFERYTGKVLRLREPEWVDYLKVDEERVGEIYYTNCGLFFVPLCQNWIQFYSEQEVIDHIRSMSKKHVKTVKRIRLPNKLWTSKSEKRKKVVMPTSTGSVEGSAGMPGWEEEDPPFMWRPKW